MKQLNPTPPPVFIIPSNQPGTRRGPDSRGIRICIAQIGRSCSLHQGYVTFTDGTAYVYDPPSNEEFEALCAAVQRGKDFNFNVRRSRSGYVKGFTPPGDYEVIYNYPPYPGAQPIACGIIPPDWTTLDWAVTHDGTAAGQTTVFTPNPGMSDTASMDFTRTAFGLSMESTMEADLTYSGGGSNSNFNLDIADPTNVLVSDWTLTVSNGGTTIFTDASFATGNFTQDFPFTVPDELTVPTNIHVLFRWEPHSGGNVSHFIATVFLSNV